MQYSQCLPSNYRLQQWHVVKVGDTTT